MAKSKSKKTEDSTIENQLTDSLTDLSIDNSIENLSDDIVDIVDITSTENPVQEVQEIQEVPSIVQTVVETPTYSDEFLTAPLKNKLTNAHHEAYKTISVKTNKNAVETLFCIQYGIEMKRLDVNAKSVIAKRKDAAKKANLSLEDYEAKLEQSGRGGNRVTEYEFTMEDYNQVALQLKRTDLTIDEKVKWLNVKNEKDRYFRNQSTKNSVAKKKERELEKLKKSAESTEEVKSDELLIV